MGSESDLLRLLPLPFFFVSPPIRNLKRRRKHELVEGRLNNEEMGRETRERETKK